jgi:hypothetical protein
MNKPVMREESDFGDAAELSPRQQVADALTYKSVMFGETGRSEESIAVYECLMAFCRTHGSGVVATFDPENVCTLRNLFGRAASEKDLLLKASQ